MTNTTTEVTVPIGGLVALGNLFTKRNELCDEVERVKFQHESAVAEFMDEAKGYAEEEEWCGVFDRSVRDLGYPQASRLESVSWTSEVDLLIDLDGEQWFDAHALTECLRGDTVEATITVEVSGTREAIRGDCVCEDVTEQELREAVEAKFGNSFDFKIDDTNTTCDNE